MPSAPQIFISYSHDSEAHRQAVLALSERLREDGLPTVLDQYLNGPPPEGWPRWMLNQFDAAQKVLVVCTQAYYRRFRGHTQPGQGGGKGGDWEGALITQDLYDSRSHNLRFVPVFMGPAEPAHVPEPLRATTHHAMVSEGAYQHLLDVLLERAGVEPGPVGTLSAKPRARGTPMRFGPGAEAPAAPASPGIAHTPPRIDITRIDRYAPADLLGRDDELAQLDTAWAQARQDAPGRPRVLSVVALGGEGKTALLARWAVNLSQRGWPGVQRAFAWSFYSQGSSEQTATSSDLFLNEALRFFGDEGQGSEGAGATPATSDQGTPIGAYEKGQRLAALLARQPSVLLLDGLEPLQYPPTDTAQPGGLKDQGLQALLKALAAHTPPGSHSLCVLSTRYAVADLKPYSNPKGDGGSAPRIDLPRLPGPAGLALLRQLKVLGPDAECAALVEDVRGHALTLTLLGAWLHLAHDGDIHQRSRISFAEADAEVQGGHAFRVMTAYAEALAVGGKTPADQQRGQRALALWRLLGLFDRPASAACLAALWQAPAIDGLTEPLMGLSEAQRRMALTLLEDARLLSTQRDARGALLAVDAHPLVREYFAYQLRTEQPDAWQAAHQRVFEHLCEHTQEGDEPTLEDLQPLYQAVAHGCRAGRYVQAFNEVLFDRILGSGTAYYSTETLGAFGMQLAAWQCFLEPQSRQVSTQLNEIDQSLVLNEIGQCLRALGRLTEARGYWQESLEMNILRDDRRDAATVTSNLIQLELTLGEVAQAVKRAEIEAGQSSTGNSQACLAMAWQQAGRTEDALYAFVKAGHMFQGPFLGWVYGFHCHLVMLHCAERACWQILLGGGKDEGTAGGLIGDCHAVNQRAMSILGHAMREQQPLDIGLGHLALGQAALYEALLAANTSGQATIAHLDASDPAILRSGQHLADAVHHLQQANRADYLPHGLLARAMLRALTGPRTGPASAQADLDEAWDIAERGPMPLYQADIHLHRARLFGLAHLPALQPPNPPGPPSPPDPGAYPWQSVAHDLAEARRLIEQCGYGRRLPELADAEAAFARLHGQPVGQGIHH